LVFLLLLGVQIFIVESGIAPVQPSAPSITIEKSIGSFEGTITISCGLSDAVFVIEGKKSLLHLFSNNGTEVKSIGGTGWGDYEFDGPSDVWSSFLLEVYVTDRNNHRIQKYDKDLNYIQTYDDQSISKLEGRFYPLACATSSRGDLFIVETDGNRILKINKRNQVESEFGTFRDGVGQLIAPKDITISGNDEIFVLDEFAVKVFDLYGNYIRTILLSNKEQWKNIHAAGRTLIATSSRIIKFIQLDTEVESEVDKSSVAGFDQTEDFQDASATKDSFYILTTTTLYRCSLP
jgi:hypothetical protein